MDKFLEFLGNKNVQKILAVSALGGGLLKLLENWNKSKKTTILFSPWLFMEGAVKGAFIGGGCAGLYQFLSISNPETLPDLDKVVEKVVENGEEVVTNISEGVKDVGNKLKDTGYNLKNKYWGRH